MPSLPFAFAPPDLASLEQKLQNSSYLPLRRVTCEWGDGCIVLRGTVDSYHLKQIAQALAVRVVGAANVRNDIQVRPEVFH
jgi:osmotically-inducible protein OsmY